MSSFSTNKNSYTMCLIKGIIISYGITLACFIVFSIILTYTSLTDSVIPTLNSIIMIISIAVGAGYMAAKVNSRGWLNGGLIGLVYILVLIIIRLIFYDGVDFNSYFLMKLLISFVTGAIGGMIGINLK